jgi:hypothetical protein
MSEPIFLLIVVGAFAAIPYGIFMFVVRATEFEMAEAGASGSLVPAPWYRASFHSAVYFLVVGPPVGWIVVCLFLLLGNTFSSHPVTTQWWLSVLYGVPYSYYFGAIPAGLCGAMYGLLQSRILRSRSAYWYVRLGVGAVSGLAAGSLFFGANGAALTAIAIAAGAITALTVRGSLYRRIFTKVAPSLAFEH